MWTGPVLQYWQPLHFEDSARNVQSQTGSNWTSAFLIFYRKGIQIFEAAGKLAEATCLQCRPHCWGPWCLCSENLCQQILALSSAKATKTFPSKLLSPAYKHASLKWWHILKTMKSGKFIFRQFCHCVNVTACTSSTLDGVTSYVCRVEGSIYCFLL